MIIANITLKRYIFLFVCALSLYAKEPNVMLLESIYANDSLLFRSKNSYVLCRPYGVWTLDRVIRRKDRPNTVCEKALEEFILHNPKLHNFLTFKMHVEQGYRVEFKKGECIVYLGSKKTLSETLLQAGLAIEEPNFKDEEFRYRFYQALRAAKRNKRGIWSDAKMRSCMSEFFKE